MRDPKRIKEFCEQLAAIWERVPDWRFGQFVSNVLGQVQTEKKRDIFFIEDDEMLTAVKAYFHIEGDAVTVRDSVSVLSKKLSDIEHDIDVLDEEIIGIKAKMTAAKTRGKPMSKECRAWFDRAGVALSIKNNQLRKLHIEKMRTEKALKAAKADVQKRRERIQNELFYAKLKELMGDGELRTFLEECQSKLEVATDESCHGS